MTATELVTALKSEGWRVDGSSTEERIDLWRPSDRKLEPRYQCLSNGNKVYPHIIVHSFDVHDFAYNAVEIEITADLMPGSWYQTKLYSMTPLDFYTQREDLIERMLTFWKAACDAVRPVDFDPAEP